MPKSMLPSALLSAACITVVLDQGASERVGFIRLKTTVEYYDAQGASNDQ